MFHHLAFLFPCPVLRLLGCSPPVHNSPRVSYPRTAQSLQQTPHHGGNCSEFHTNTPRVPSPPELRVTRLLHSPPPPGPQAAPGSDTTVDFFSFTQQVLPVLLRSIKGWSLATHFQAPGRHSYSLYPGERALAISHSMAQAQKFHPLFKAPVY